MASGEALHSRGSGPASRYQSLTPLRAALTNEKAQGRHGFQLETRNQKPETRNSSYQELMQNGADEPDPE